MPLAEQELALFARLSQLRLVCHSKTSGAGSEERERERAQRGRKKGDRVGGESCNNEVPTLQTSLASCVSLTHFRGAECCMFGLSGGAPGPGAINSTVSKVVALHMVDLGLILNTRYGPQAHQT